MWCVCGRNKLEEAHSVYTHTHTHTLDCFKSVTGREEYLDLIKVIIYRTALARFRLGMSPPRSMRTDFVAHFHRQIVRAHKVEKDEAPVFLDCFVYGNIKNVYINKAQNISVQDQGLSVLKCTDQSEQFGCPRKLLVSSSANA